MAIITVDQAKDYLRNELATVDDTQITTAIGTATSFIQAFTQRQWVVASGTSARVYRPIGPVRILRIHDAVSVSSVVENGRTLTLTTDYLLEPLNQLSLTGETRPYEQIRRMNTVWYAWQDSATISVTASWGWAAIPDAVTNACLILTKDILGHRDIRFGIAGFTEYAGVRAKTSSIVNEMLADYRRAESFGL